VIGREETDEKVKAFKKKHGFSFPMAADPEGAVFSLFAKDRIPRTYIISKEGKVCSSTTGFAGEEHFAEIKTAVRRELAK
jgi:peroxiredoxin